MDCWNARVAVSALLDGEPLGAEPSELAVHIAGCAECRLWQERAHSITRRVRLAPATPAPAANPELLDSIRADLPALTRGRARQLTVARVLLVLLAAAQIVTAVPALILGNDREAPLHVAHEMGSFDMALAVGFAIVALQPARARGMHLLVGAMAALLVTTAALDITAGRTTMVDEAPHLLVVAGWLLMLKLAELAPDGRGHNHGGVFRPVRRGPLLAGARRTLPTRADDDLGVASRSAPAQSARRAAAGT